MEHKDVLFDLLFTEKSLSGIYNTYVNEATESVKKELLVILDGVHTQQNQIFEELHNSGNYVLRPADMKRVMETKEKFSCLQN